MSESGPRSAPLAEETEAARSRPDVELEAPKRPLLPILAAVTCGCLLSTSVAPAEGAGPGRAGLLVSLALPFALPTARARGAAWLCAIALLVACRGWSVTDSARNEHTGTWTSLGARSDGRARLGTGGARYELEGAWIDEGDLVRLLPGAPPRTRARGPVSVTGGEAHASHAVAPDEVVRLAARSAGLMEHLAAPFRSFRAAGLARMRSWSGEHSPALGAALLFGDRSALDPEVSDLFTRTGSRHLLAVSGLHVAIFAAMCIWPLGALCALVLGRWSRFLARKEPWRALLVLTVVPLAGAGAPVVRASLCLAFAALAPLMRSGAAANRLPRRADALSLWSLALCAELVSRPAAIESLSLQLSYAATGGLILGVGGARRLLCERWPGGGSIAARDALGRPRAVLPRALATRFLRAWITGTAAAVTANLATLPLVWHHFGEWCAWDVLSTSALLPQLGAFLLLSWLRLLVPIAPFAAGCELLAGSMVATLEIVDLLPGTPLSLPPRPLALLGAASLLVLAWLRVRGSASRLAPWTGRIAAGAWGCLLLPWTLAPALLEVHALDVGHGTAVVWRSPSSGVWIFDAGSRDRGSVARGAVAPLLRAWDTKRVSIVLSHADRDHAGALPWLARRYACARWIGALPAVMRDRLPADCEVLDSAGGPLRLRAGDLDLELVRAGRAPGNEGSRSLILESGAQRLLLSGDADGDGLGELLEAGLLDGPFDLALLPHHASEHERLSEFFERARPRRCWISASGRPRIEEELERRGLEWEATGVHGPLSWSPP